MPCHISVILSPTFATRHYYTPRHILDTRKPNECPLAYRFVNCTTIINLVAFFLPPARLPTSIYGAVQRPVDIKNRPRIPIPDEDPYSVAGNGGGSSGSSGFGASGSGMVAASREHLMQPTQPMGGQRRSEKPPKLPPRDNLYATHEIGKPDYDDIEDENRVKLPRGKSDKGKDNKKYDDPYYCGLRARVPNFVKSSKSSKENNNNGPNAAVGGSKETVASKRLSIAHLQHPASLQSLHQLHQMHPHHNLMAAHQHHQQLMWHARSYESGIGE
uniref:Uncharacterized protein n=1 Tax=Anopheles maculatus TaxID=74869 RepID=A0A182T215_9DIPT